MMAKPMKTLELHYPMPVYGCNDWWTKGDDSKFRPVVKRLHTRNSTALNVCVQDTNLLLYSTMELKHQLHWRQEPQTFLDAVVVGVFPGNTEPSSDSMPVMQPGLGHG